jgi:acetyl esterase/lipase
MKSTPLLSIASLLFVLAPWLQGAAPEPAPKPDTLNHQLRTYKTTPQGQLQIELFLPVDWKPSDARPAIVFFFGGGWTNGNRRQFVPQCQYLASRGMVAATADYRIKSIHKTTPDLCVEDAKSAVRWMRQHAGELGIDPKRVAAGGGSAGGHIAAATALLPGFNSPGEDASVSSVPNALVLFNPVLDMTEIAPKFFPGSDEAKAKIAHDLSPNAFITKQTPPAVIFFGTNDALGVGGQAYIDRSAETGNRADLYLAEGMKHSFFNRPPWFESTLRQSDEFLTSLGYLQGKPTIALNPKALLKRAEPHKAETSAKSAAARQ